MILFSNCSHTSDENENKEATFEELVSQGDFPEAKLLLSKETATPIMYNMADLLYGDWILEILASDDADKQNKIIQLFGQYPIKGEKMEGLQSSFFNEVTSSYEYDDFNDGWYAKGSSHYNKLCDKIFNSAILMKNYEIANDIIELYIQDPEITNGSYKTDIFVDGKKIDGAHSYVKYTWKSKEAAQKKLNEAKKNNNIK